MNKKLFLCNSVFQVLIAVWMKYNMFSNCNADIIISNHMNGYLDIAKNVKKTGLFKNVFTVETLDYTRNRFFNSNNYYNKVKRRFLKLFPNLEIKNFIDIEYNYDEMFIANSDQFSRLLYSAQYKKTQLKLNYFEDGTATYSKLHHTFYQWQSPPENKFKNFILCKIFNAKFLYGNASCFYVFNKDAMMWDPGCKIEQIEPISCENEFISIVNKIFSYDNMTDLYDKKYIFLEESYYADSGYMEDVELVEKIAQLVGKENIMVKIHPRNPENRFEKLGYKTNKNTSIPWEVILINNDFSDKVLITIASSSIINSMALFNKKIESYSLIECLKKIPGVLKGDLTDCILNFYKTYSDSIHICKDINDIAEEK